MPLGAAVLALLGGAASSGLLIADAAAHVARRPDDDGDTDTPLLLVPSNKTAGYLAHGSHSSHSSHQQPFVRRRWRRWRTAETNRVPRRPRHPRSRLPRRRPHLAKPATVSFVAYPGGRIFVDGQLVGQRCRGRSRSSLDRMPSAWRTASWASRPGRSISMKGKPASSRSPGSRGIAPCRSTRT